ncbi:GAF domain-containing protein [Chondrinema litorale]|uniref:GAF domain-containing protein n=1 Tax=Chondrinema litorale TaxID=2994555 RepID=UPI0025433917|nr:GAF domain-containing protein [Chondrinema litorale]UZR94800.1 GAF domain-containing protein [Chondrinema litorale]
MNCYYNTRINSVLSFEKLINFLKNKAQTTDNKATVVLINYLLSELDKHPELQGEIRDTEVLAKNKDLVEQLMSSIFSPIDFDKQIVAVVSSFDFSGLVYSTSRWLELINMEAMNFKVKNVDIKDIEANKNVYINNLILYYVYGYPITVKNNVLLNIPDPKTGLNKYYKVYFDLDFAEITSIGKPPKLTDDQVKMLAEDPTNIKLWEKYINLKNFELKGFIILRLMDVTQNEIISSLKYDLLERDAIISREKFSLLEGKLRDLYELPDLRLGIVSFNADAEGKGKGKGPKIWNSIIHEEDLHNYLCEKGVSKEDAFNGCVYHRMFDSGESQTIGDLEKISRGSAVEQILLQKGIRSIIVSPLHYNGVCLGGIEIGSPNADDFNSTSTLMLREILPIFSLAAKRSLEELESKLQAIIKEQYTAVHPSVEWKFVQSALNKMNRKTDDSDSKKGEAIVFNDIYPIYGQSDIRGSSTERNNSIQEDLIEQLRLANDVLHRINDIQPLGIIEEISSRIIDTIDSIKDGIGSGDEMSILFFLKNEIEPLLHHFRKSNRLSAEPYQYYFNQLDPELGILYRKRKAFEDSLTRINDKVANYLESQQLSVQKSYPHYFEKYKTDGVEYNIYIGQSITPDKEFDMIYLHDLRLWQLKNTARIAQITDQLKYSLPLPLETTHLILVNSAPISIRFREDEKQFDVDGAYNIRYEIIKKRIDKANIKDSDERITQPGKIAIVYTQDKEAEEYKKYIRFLQKQGLLEDEIENYQLQELQGVNGLRALRVQVKMKDPVKSNKFPEEVIEKVFQS